MANGIGGMLASTGTNIGQQVGGAYRGLGQDIAGMLTGVGDGIVRRRQEREAKEAEELLRQFGDNPEKLRELANQYELQGKNEVAEVFSKAREQYTAQQKLATTATQGRGEGELMALANDPQFDLNNQKMRVAYLGMADSYGVSRADAMQIALDAIDRQKKDKEEEKSKPKYSKTNEVTIRDSKGNTYLQYAIQNINEPDSTPIIKQIPIGNSPQNPVGNTTIVSDVTGAGAFDKPEIAGEAKQASDFAELQVEASNALPDLQSDARVLQDAIAALDTMSSQGLPESVANKIFSEFGVQNPDIAEYEMLVGELMYSRLKPLFGGVISEGERAAVERLYNNLKRGKAANRAILNQLQKKIDESIVKSNLIRRATSYDDYNKSLDTLYPEKTEEVDSETKEDLVIDWNSLP